MGENPNTKIMGIYVTWGINHPSYDQLSKEYNTPIEIWRRYSENIKRGYILSYPVKNPTKSTMGSDFTMGLLDLEEMRRDGIQKLYDSEQKKVSEKTLRRKLKSFIDGVIEFYGEEYHQWGLSGDKYSFENNPFEIVE
jgi:hypothetical protein